MPTSLARALSAGLRSPAPEVRIARRVGYQELMELEQLSTRALLRLFVDILTELIHRGVVRSRNAPAGDLAEYLVANAFGGELAPPSEKSWDVRVGDRCLQVKVRLIAAGDRRSHTYSPFRSWNFDACVFVLLDAQHLRRRKGDRGPGGGRSGTRTEVKSVKGFRIGTRADLRNVTGAVDRTAELRQAVAAFG